MFNNKIVLKSQQRFKSNHHNVYTEEIIKIALSGNDDKRLQTFNRVTIYPYGTNAFKVYENKMLEIKRFIHWKIIIINNYKNNQLWQLC